MPMELAATLARKEACAETGLPPEEIGVFAIVPCPAKVTAAHNPEGLTAPVLDGALSIRDVYLHLLHPMEELPPEKLLPMSAAGATGVGVAVSGGTSRARQAGRYVAVDGTCLTDLSEEERTVFRRKEIGFVFQKYNLLPSITVLENLLLPLKLLDMEIQREEVEMLAEKLGIREKLYQMPDTLSGGQQQRVAIARALLYRPPVILADEPTGSLDRRTGTAVLEQMRDMSRQYGQTLIVVTHDEKIAKMADRMICLEDGEVVKDEWRQEGISAVGGETVEKSL